MFGNKFNAKVKIIQGMLEPYEISINDKWIPLETWDGCDEPYSCEDYRDGLKVDSKDIEVRYKKIYEVLSSRYAHITAIIPYHRESEAFLKLVLGNTATSYDRDYIIEEIEELEGDAEFIGDDEFIIFRFTYYISFQHTYKVCFNLPITKDLLNIRLISCPLASLVAYSFY